MSYVLLIEPNSVLAQAYTQFLTHAGFVVQQATTAQAAIGLADRQTPAVVLLELQLPLHNGVEFLHEFRSYSEWLPVPVVVNTTLPPARTEVLAPALRHDLGVVDILYKPRASLDEVLRAVRAAVQGAGAAQTGTDQRRVEP
jgi:DNA-binding response OmpR family regulator